MKVTVKLVKFETANYWLSLLQIEVSTYIFHLNLLKYSDGDNLLWLTRKTQI